MIEAPIVSSLNATSNNLATGQSVRDGSVLQANPFTMLLAMLAPHGDNPTPAVSVATVGSPVEADAGPDQAADDLPLQAPLRQPPDNVSLPSEELPTLTTTRLAKRDIFEPNLEPAIDGLAFDQGQVTSLTANIDPLLAKEDDASVDQKSPIPVLEPQNSLATHLELQPPIEAGDSQAPVETTLVEPLGVVRESSLGSSEKPREIEGTVRQAASASVPAASRLEGRVSPTETEILSDGQGQGPEFDGAVFDDHGAFDQPSHDQSRLIDAPSTSAARISASEQAITSEAAASEGDPAMMVKATEASGDAGDVEAEVQTKDKPVQTATLKDFGHIVSRHAQNGSRHITIQLEPMDLGQVDVALEFGREGTLSGTIKVERAETLELMMRDRGTIEKLLQDQGFTLDGKGMSFDLSQRREESGAESSHGQARYGEVESNQLEEGWIPQRTFVSDRLLDLSI